MAMSPELIESMAKDLYWRDAIPQGKRLWRERAEHAITMYIANMHMSQAFPNATVIEDE